MSPLARNLVVLAGLAIVLASACVRRGRPRDLPFPRSRALAALLPAIVAILATAPTLVLPYLGDDVILLEQHGAKPTPFHVWKPDAGEEWLRPIGWMAWWLYDRVAPVDATLAHAVSVALFAAVAALAVPALRRCGTPRGIAVAGATLFAAHPAALETVAWATNLYSILSCGFSLLAVATLPWRRATPRRLAAPLAFALLALLSKEDSYLLPLWIAAAAARFRARGIGRGLRIAAPFAALLAVVVVARFPLLDGFGAGTRPSVGAPPLVSNALEGPWKALRTEAPAAYVLPVRRVAGEDESAWMQAAAWLPALLLALGGASGAARRCAPIGVAIALLGLAPTSSQLPVGATLALARELFTPALGIALIVASLAAGIAWLGRARWVAVMALVAASLVVGRRNFSAWERAGEAVNAAVASAVPLVRDAPSGTRFVVYGFPDSVDGALAGRYAVPAIRRAAGRRDVETVGCWTSSVPPQPVDRLLVLDFAASTARDVTHEPPARSAARGETIRFELARGEAERFNVEATAGADGAVEVRAFVPDAALVFPRIALPPGATVTVVVDGEARWNAGGAAPIPVVATFPEAGRLTRLWSAGGGTGTLPADASWLRVELLPPLGATLSLRAVSVTVR